jgi:hypothetical protein
MSEEKQSIVIIHLDTLTDYCGHYYEDDRVCCNSYYNCDHPDCEDIEYFNPDGSYYEGHSYEEPGVFAVGRCFSFSCPIADSADLEDMQLYDPELAKEFENDEFVTDSEYMTVYDEIAEKYIKDLKNNN